MPTASAPSAGHQLQCSGSALNQSSTLYSDADNVADSAPHSSPAMMHDGSASTSGTAVCSGNSGAGGSSSGRTNPATAHATATGSRLRGRSSNSRSSTASSTAATGVPN